MPRHTTHMDRARSAKREANALLAELRNRLAGAAGDPEAQAHYAAEVATLEDWIDGWPDSALPRHLVEG